MAAEFGAGRHHQQPDGGGNSLTGSRDADENRKAEAWPARIQTAFADQPLAVLSREHLIRNKRDTGRTPDLDAIALHCSRLPVQDSRSADEILGYDERGLPR
jgi:antitoxin VapB